MPYGSSYQKWTDEQLALIEQVKKHPTLYMKNENNYVPNEQVWNNISKELGRSVDSCRRSWKIIRDNYIKKKKLLSENYIVYSSKYLDTDILQFLELRTTPANKWSPVLEPLPINEEKKDKNELNPANSKAKESFGGEKKHAELLSSPDLNPAVNMDEKVVNNTIPDNTSNNQDNTGKIKKRRKISKPPSNLQDKNDQNTQKTLIANKHISMDNIQEDTCVLYTANENTVNNFQENIICSNVESAPKKKSRKKSSKKKSDCNTVTNINDLSNINEIISSTESELPPDILDSILNTTDEDVNASNHYDMETVVNLNNITNDSSTSTLITQDIIDSVLTNTERESESTEYLHTVVNLDTNCIESSFIDTDTSGVTFNDINQYSLITPEGDTLIPVSDTFSDPISLNTSTNNEVIQTAKPPATKETDDTEDPLIWTTVPSNGFDFIDNDDPPEDITTEANTVIVPDKNVDLTLVNDEPTNNIFNVYDLNSEKSDIKTFFNDMADYVSRNLCLKKQMELRLHICAMLTKAELGEVEQTDTEDELNLRRNLNE